MSLRTWRTERWYRKFLKTGELQEFDKLPAIREWKHWKLVMPIATHNKHHTEHLMLVLKRPCKSIWRGLSDQEILSLFRTVLPNIDNEFDYFKINLKPRRTIDNYVHFHVLTYKKRYQ